MPARKQKKPLEEILRATELKVTVPRLAVLSVLASSGSPMRIKDVEKQLREQCKEIDTVTIYRTIETLKKKGMVKRVRLDDDAAYFELVDPERHYHHFTCYACGKCTRINRCVFPKYRPMLLRDFPEFSEITDHEIEFFGTCTKCTKKRPSSALPKKKSPKRRS